RRADVDVERQLRRNSGQSLIQKRLELFLRVTHAAERRAHVGAHAFAILLREVEAAVIDRELGTRDGEMAETVQALGALPVHEIARLEPVDFTRVLAAERRRVETRDSTDGRFLRADSFPEPGGRDSDGGHRANAGDG